MAVAAPQIEKLEAILAEKLANDNSLESKQRAEQAAKAIIGVALLTAGETSGLDVSSTMMATNVEVNNRQLHPDEIRFILDESRVRRFASKYDLSVEEAKKELIEVSLAYVDSKWRSIYDLDKDYLKEGNYTDETPAPRTLTFVWNEMNSEQQSLFKPTDETFYNNHLNKNEVFADKFARDAYYKYASVPLNISPSDALKIHRSYKLGEQQGVQNVLAEKYETIKNLPNLTYEQIAKSTIATAQHAYNIATDERYRNETIQNYIGEKKDDAINFVNDIQLDALQGNYDDVAHKIGELEGEIKTNLAIEAAIAVGTGASANVAKKAVEKIVKDAVDSNKVGNPANNLPDVYGDGDLPNVYDRQRQWIDADKPYTEKSRG